MKFLKITLITIITLLVLGCGESKFEAMSNSELKKKERHCDSIPKKSAVFANGCAKISEEVKSRRKARNKK